MPDDPRPITGPVSLPANPRAVAESAAAGLASLGLVNRPPSEREYEHAALDQCLRSEPEENVHAVLAHLDVGPLRDLSIAARFLSDMADLRIADIQGPQR